MSKQLVKERVIKYLMEDLLVPHDMIDTDVPLSEFEEGAEGIIDIIVSVKDKEDYLVPVMLVSCLDEDVELEGEVVQKQIDFLEDVDNITTAGRIILTNGNQMMYADWTGEEYDTEAALPTYEQMEKELPRYGGTLFPPALAALSMDIIIPSSYICKMKAEINPKLSDREREHNSLNRTMHFKVADSRRNRLAQDRDRPRNITLRYDDDNRDSQ